MDHSITINPLALDHHIANINPNAIVHLTSGRQFGVTGFEFFLNGDSALDRIHGAGKFGQQIVARRIHNPAMMLLNEGGHDLAIGREGANGGGFIVAHQATIPLDIGTQNRSQLALHTPAFLR
jgi:hypothetical protein